VVIRRKSSNHTDMNNMVSSMKDEKSNINGSESKIFNNTSHSVAVNETNNKNYIFEEQQSSKQQIQNYNHNNHGNHLNK
jgi:hypothetical protein